MATKYLFYRKKNIAFFVWRVWKISQLWQTDKAHEELIIAL